MLEEVESLAIDYFELNGFLVRKAWHSVQDRELYASLIVRNLREEEVDENLNLSFQWFSSDVLKTRRAVVAFVGESVIESGKPLQLSDRRFFQSLKKGLIAKGSAEFPWECDTLEKRDLPGHRRLVLCPAIPTPEAAREELFSILRKRGAEGILTIRTLLDNLIQQLDQLEKSQATPRINQLRMLKLLGLLKVSQMDLFGD